VEVTYKKSGFCVPFAFSDTIMLSYIDSNS